MKRMSDERFDAVCLFLEIEREHLTRATQMHMDEGRKAAAEATSAVHDALVEALGELRRLREKEGRWTFFEEKMRAAGYAIDWYRAEELSKKGRDDA